MIKIKFIFFSIITFGIFYFIAVSRSKEIRNQQIQRSTKVNININELLEILDGSENITDVSATINSLIISLKHSVAISQDELKNLKIIGINKIGSNKIILVIGNNALTIAEAIKQKIKQ